MIKIQIAEVAQSQGIKSAYALQKALDISPTIASRLWKGDFDKIGIGTLNKLCEGLKCQPNRLFRYEKGDPLPSDAPASKQPKKAK